MKKIVTLMIIAISFTSAIAQIVPDIEWQKLLGGYADDKANAIKQTPDGGYVIAGGTKSTNGDVTGKHNNEDFWIVKLDAEGNITWEKCLGGSGDEQASSVQTTSDNGFVVAGWTTSNDFDVSGNHGNKDFWVVKLDDSGNIQWQKCYGGSNEDVGYEIQQTYDDGYIVAGNTKSSDGNVSGIHSAGVRDIWIVKLNAEGIIKWAKCFGGSAEEYFNANSLQETSDSGYVFNGYTWSNNDGDVTSNHGANDYWTVKLNSSGEIEWQRSSGGTSTDGGYTIHQTTDGGCIAAGAAYSNDGDVSGAHGFSDCWIIKFDDTGNIDWQKPYGGENDERPIAIRQTAEGGYIFAGWSSSETGDVTGYHFAPFTTDSWIAKLDESGNLTWQKCLGGFGSDEAHSIEQTDDGGFILAGFSYSNDGDVSGNHGGSDYWIIKLSPSCNGITVFADADNDSYGNSANNILVEDCIVPKGYVLDNTDCNDDPVTGGTVFPGALEVCNNIDDNCNGQIDENCEECATPVAVSSTQITSTTAKLKWEVVNEAIFYKVSFKIAGTSEWKTIKTINSSKTLHELEANTEYTWKVKSLCSLQPNVASDWSEKLFFTTAPLRLANESDAQSIAVYPNPFISSATISFGVAEASPLLIELMDVNGRTVRVIAKGDFPAGNHEITLDRGALAAGIYFLQLKTAEGVMMKKLILE